MRLESPPLSRAAPVRTACDRARFDDTSSIVRGRGERVPAGLEDRGAALRVTYRSNPTRQYWEGRWGDLPADAPAGLCDYRTVGHWALSFAPLRGLKASAQVAGLSGEPVPWRRALTADGCAGGSVALLSDDLVLPLVPGLPQPWVPGLALVPAPAPDVLELAGTAVYLLFAALSVETVENLIAVGH